MFGQSYRLPSRPFCGCWFMLPNTVEKRYLPQVELESHTTILAATSRTILHQTFVNPLSEALNEVSYTFPLYDGVSIAGFKCTVAGRVIVGVVKERNQARADYREAVSKGQTAGLLEQSIDAADVFTTSIGNVPAGEKLLVEITYLGELKNDAETDGARFTIPTQIAPRYGAMAASTSAGLPASDRAGMKITVDIALEQGVSIRGIQSPSHPIAVTMGRTSTMMEDDDTFESNLGSSTLALGNTELEKDFIVVVLAKGQDTPRALLETHPTLPNQRAVMTTLVPKFNIPSGHPEIVFIVDRSGSMSGKMHLVIEAMKVFLKSLPVSVKFNICSFGSHHTFLFEKSKTYDATSLQAAIDHLNPGTFDANYGGTEMLHPVKAVLERRYRDLPLEALLLTDGQIWNQDALFDVVNEASKQNGRFFTLGVGSSASSSLVEGIARAGRGFSQWVDDGERIDKRLVRMLKGALTPHIRYKLEVRYAAAVDASEDDFEIVESFEKSMKLITKENATTSKKTGSEPVKQGMKKIISLFDTKSEDEPPNPAAGRYDHLPATSVPNVLQIPHQLPELYPHSRSTVYLLLGVDAPQTAPTSVTIRGTSDHGDLELEVPVQDIGTGDTIHKLAAKKAMQDLEEGRGWLTEAHAAGGETFKSQNEGTWDLIVEREAVRLGTTFQVGGKFCSFVAVDESDKDKDVPQRETSKSPIQQHQESLMLGQQSKSQKRMTRAVARSSSGSLFGASHNTSSYQPQAMGASSGSASLFGGTRPPSHTGVPSSGSPFNTSSSFGSNAQPNRSFSRSSTSAASPIPPSGLFGNSAGGFGTTAAQSFMAPALAAPSLQIDYSDKDDGAGSTNQFADFHLDYSTLENADVLENFDFDSFLSDPVVDASATPSTKKAAVASVDALAPLERMQKLIDLQTFSGSWTITQGLLAIVSHGATTPFGSAVDVERAIGEKGAAMGSEAQATVLAIAWLEVVMSDEKDVWDMVVEKAKGWLEGRMDGSEAVEESIKACKGAWKV